jgi:bifunctional DNA-binding transcriptional regulator/antitoxin component of YhaV-PrlF toxin-antitoxin module
MSNEKRYTVQLLESGEDLILPIPDELLKEVGWKEGDVLNFKPNDEGGFIMEKVENTETELVLVEAMSMFLMRYVVEVPKGKAEWALDTVTCEEAVELSQKHLGEHIVSHRVINEKEFFDVFDEDNDYLKKWDADKKKGMITRINKDGDLV